jgi:hypothetical protein
MSFYYDRWKGMNCLGDLEINGVIIVVIKYIQIKLVTRIYAVAFTLQQNIKTQSFVVPFLSETVNCSERITSSRITMSK